MIQRHGREMQKLNNMHINDEEYEEINDIHRRFAPYEQLPYL